MAAAENQALNEAIAIRELGGILDNFRLAADCCRDPPRGVWRTGKNPDHPNLLRPCEMYPPTPLDAARASKPSRTQWTVRPKMGVGIDGNPLGLYGFGLSG